MSKQPNDNKTSTGKKPTDELPPLIHLPPGFAFPPGLPSFEEMQRMTPLPGMEEDFALALRTIASFAGHDFNKEIDLENACGHKAPGVVMKDGYCEKCHESENIPELNHLLDLAEKYGPDEACEMMKQSTSGSSGGSSSSKNANAAKRDSTDKKNASTKKD